MKSRIWLSLAAAVFSASCSSVPPSERTVRPVAPWFDPRLDSLVAPTLRRFGGTAEFERYRRQLHSRAREFGASWARALPAATGELVATIGAAGTLDVCDPALDECGVLEEIAVTAARVAKPSITNNQEPGVDEGDIVKQVGRFLVVLQDGRLFSIDMGASPGTMSFVDRINVYPDAERGAWYDELLTTDDRLVVVGYDYDEDVTELAVFEIDAAGVFTFEVTYHIKSNDYYSSDNYAARLVDGNLVLYTPLYLIDSDPDKPQSFPQIRRWTERDGYSEWQPLFTAADIYFPIQRSLEPTVHTVSVCPLAGELRCRSTGLIGPAWRELYVTPQFAYLWLSTSSFAAWDLELGACDDGVANGPFRPLPPRCIAFLWRAARCAR